jgi:hypothetical protein
MTIKFKYDLVSKFHTNNQAEVLFKGKWITINKKGRKINN